LKLDHIYYKNDSLYVKFKASNSKNGAADADASYVPSKDSRLIVEELVKVIN
jgi:hypothetical protein